MERFISNQKHRLVREKFFEMNKSETTTTVAWHSAVHGFGLVGELAELANGSAECGENGEGWVFICPELQRGKGGGEKS